MSLQTLFEMQKALDAYIEQNKSITKDVFREKGLALLVELAELANETRCFKFWSDKSASERSAILEEYVDSIHFLLSLGNEKGYNELDQWPTYNELTNLTDCFLQTNEAIVKFLAAPSQEHYLTVWKMYSNIAQILQFTLEEIIQAYIKKNEKNYVRQQTGY